MRKTIMTVLVAGLAFLTACNEEPKKEVKTVQWYNEHPKERAEQLKICANNPGQLKDDPNCINAKQSMLQKSGGYID
ncbi:MAG: EexN family lipoprotein [Desulfovibrio sp.]|uniref:EexN family lipoprotein n=1 Tax=Desulfovibrio sp. TaxID=885 RepID=UPI00258F1186|nr:EexN family lipoprotein [Desulfovibrio sp.]MCD7984835.1 EexN family lipoprotein [Desulfovibrio sp.]